MAHYSKLASGKWRVIVKHQRQTATKTFSTKGQAERWAMQTVRAMEDGTFTKAVGSQLPTFREALDRYEREITPTKKGRRAEKYRIGVVRRAPFAGKPLDNVSPEDISVYRDARLAIRSPQTVYLELALLSHVFKVARSLWRIDVANPVKEVARPRVRNKRNRRLNGNEEQRLMEALYAYPNPEFRVIVLLGLYTAARYGELIHLAAGQISLENRTIFLPDTKNGQPRYVPLSPQAIACLEGFMRKDANPKERLFSYSYFGFLSSWRKFKRKLGMDDLRFHDFRHERTSQLVEAGWSDIAVMAVTGHQSPEMLKRYAHLRAEHLARRLAKDFPS